MVKQGSGRLRSLQQWDNWKPRTYQPSFRRVVDRLRGCQLYISCRAIFNLEVENTGRREEVLEVDIDVPLMVVLRAFINLEDVASGDIHSYSRHRV